MSVDIGSAKGNFVIKGLVETLRDLRATIKVLGNVDNAIKKSGKANREYVADLKKAFPAYKQLLKDTDTIAAANKKLKATYDEVRRSLHSVIQEQKKYNIAPNLRGQAASNLGAITPSAGLGNFKSYASRARSFISGTLGSLKTAAEGTRVILAKVFSVPKSLKTLSSRVGRLTQRINENSHAATSWWTRFGLVAGGFWIAYRAINALEYAISTLTRTFASGIKIMDEYQEGVAGIAGMIALTYSGGKDFQDRFTRVSAVMRETMQEMIRLTPRFRLSADEVAQSMRELAQFGVIIRKNQAEGSLAVFNMIKEISMTTGSSTKQLRQEIQALFTGTARVTDQFARMLKRTMPDLYAKLKSSAITANEKWQLLIDRVKDFSIAVKAANSTVTGQAEIMQNSLSIISQKALKTSGIYSQWVGFLMHINEQLFNADGTLGSLGKKVASVFTVMWQTINGIILSVYDIYTWFHELYNTIASKLSPEIIQFGKRLLQWIVILAIVKNAFSAIWIITKSIAALSGLTAVLKLPGVLAQVIPIVTQFTALAAAIATGVGAGKAFVRIWYSVGTAFGNMFEQITFNFKTRLHWLVTVFSVFRDNISTMIDEMFKNIEDRSPLKKFPAWANMVDPMTRFNEGLAEGLDKADKVWSDGMDGMKQAALDTILSSKDALKELLKTIGDNKTVQGIVGNIEGKLNQLLSRFQYKTRAISDNYIKHAGADYTPLTSISDIKPPPIVEDVDKKVKAATVDITGKVKYMYEYLSDSTKSFFDDVFHGRLKSAQDAFTSFATAIADAFQNAMTDIINEYFKQMAKLAFKGAFQNTADGFFAQIFGIGQTPTNNIGGSSIPASDWSAIHTMATGGIIKEPVVGVGLNSGESYSFAERGAERVLSNKDSFSASNLNVSVNVINQSGQPIQGKAGKVKFDGSQYVVDVILHRLATDPNFRSAIGAG